MTRIGALYLALATAAIADVATRALLPATVVDLSSVVVLVGYGLGFVVLKAAAVVATIGMAEVIRRVPLALTRRWPATFTEIAWISRTAPFVPLCAIAGWTYGALTNVARLAA